MAIVNGQSGPWYCCPSCAGEQVESNQSVWNRLTGDRMGLEQYIDLDRKGFKPQEVFGILGCPLHPARRGLPQGEDARTVELLKFLDGRRKPLGGIQPVRE